MSTSPEPFAPSDHPELPASSRPLSLTPELVALCYRDEADPGLNERLTPMDDADYAALAERLEAEAHGRPLWVFAYGSLIWKPEFLSVESRRATAYGWHRAFR